jgi:hypothetical protein
VREAQQGKTNDRAYSILEQPLREALLFVKEVYTFATFTL